MSSPAAGSLSPAERHRSVSPRSDFLAIPEFGSPNYTSASSPTSLSVPGSWWGFGSVVIGGAGDYRRTSSAGSSIFDLSAECEQLERALKENDVATVKKFLQLHHTRFPLDVHASFLDKSSCDSHSRRQSHVSQDVEILLRKSQTLIDTLERHRDSETQTEDTPNIFRSSLHVAIQYSSLDVLKVLLKYGVDPNEPSCFTHQPRSRRSSNYSTSDAVSPTVPFISLPGQHQQQNLPYGDSRQHSPVLPTPPPEQPYACEETRHPAPGPAPPSAFTPQGLRYIAASASKGGGRRSYEWQSWSLQTSGVNRSPASNRGGPFTSHLPEIVETSVENGFNFSDHYSKDELLSLPCLYLAVVDGNPYVVQLLLRYGAQANVQDSHGCSPLHLACSQDYFNLENIRSLLKYGAKIHMKNVNNDTPFSLYPDIVAEQRAVVRAALARITLPQPGKPRSRTSTITNPNIREYAMPSTPTHEQMASSRSGSVSRFFKRLSSDARPRGRRITRDESSNFTSDVVRERTYSTDVMRERTYSSGSCKSLRSRHFSSCVQDDLESDFSLVRYDYINPTGVSPLTTVEIDDIDMTSTLVKGLIDV